MRNILKEEGIEPGPNRKNDCWDNFVKRHAETLWAVDFFSVMTVTLKGLRDMYLMVWLCLETREVIVSESTEYPNSAWVVEQTNEFLEQTLDREKVPSIVMHDRDTKFTKEFTQTLEGWGVRTNKLPITSPNLNGRDERFGRTLGCVQNQGMCYRLGVRGIVEIRHWYSSGRMKWHVMVCRKSNGKRCVRCYLQWLAWDASQSIGG